LLDSLLQELIAATYQSIERNRGHFIKECDQCSEKMIPSLKYLCLEKVIAQDEDYADLPKDLVRDIDLLKHTYMKVFNGTYIWMDSWETVELKIFYDGKVWTFRSRTWSHESDGEGPDGAGVCFCKYCWDTTGSKLIDFTVKEGEVIPAESSLLDFLGIPRRAQKHMKLSGLKFKVDLQSNEEKHPWLVKQYGEVKSMGAIAFYGVGEGESTVFARFQVEVVNTPEREGWFGQLPAREWTHLHRKVTGSVNYSELYTKDSPGFEAMHHS